MAGQEYGRLDPWRDTSPIDEAQESASAETDTDGWTDHGSGGS